ncbi:xanthine dehydrogenase family protein molybdopterin-binding subunit [Afipia sp. GAS231]|uniref:xanthine dehydrogenase family protein molybdopterin-binding subunit n=1 Tax=Afipia sp. GAS231 TaxID=1882747 RepID=UPI00087BB0D9|nr:xanthine dehydrogenase family protein molybdopterin-binding subunit [Afipia sp. GAS231]SDO54331.1 carbon-monoxide dehydrogenase large subunit [Afipia sp. GAS231]
MTIEFRGRREDVRLLKGQGRYTADWSLPDETHACFLRSDRAHADIVSIDASQAIALPGVITVLTGQDVIAAGHKNAPNPVWFLGKGEMKLRTPRRPCLATDRVRYVGQEVALVVASSAAIALDAIENILVEYRDRDAIIEPEEALRADAPVLHEDQPHNIAFEYEYGDAAATDEAFRGARHVARVNLDCQRMVGNPMEPKSCLASYDAGTDTLEMYLPTQGTSMMQAEFAAALGMPIERIRLHAQDVGGGFGVRGEVYPEYMALALAAKTIGRPVKWLGTRSESFVSDHHGRAERHMAELALDENGRFLAIRVEWLVNMGAFCSNAGPYIHTLAHQGQVAGPYLTPTAFGFHRLLFTNTTPTTAYRGAARPNTAYIVEQLIDEAAQVTAIDRIELRRRNLIPKDAFPYKTPAGAVYDSGDPHRLIDRVLSSCDWAGFEERRAGSAKGGKLRGLGVAMFIEPSGGGLKDEVSIKFASWGGVDIFSPVGPSGQGNETVFPEIVAEHLGLPVDKVVLRYNDPDGPILSGLGSISSRTLMNHGSGFVLAAQEVIKKATLLAADVLEVSVPDVAFKSGMFRVEGTDLSIGLLDLARRYFVGRGEHPLDVKTESAAVTAWATGAHAAEIEIDAETGELEILRYVAVDDCGRLINPTIVAGQIHGGIAQGVGQAIGEACIYDNVTGQLITGSFMDYFMPRARDLPFFELHDEPTYSPTNPLGAKGVGEAGTTGAVPTLGSALRDALKPLGIYHVNMPYTPARLWSLLKSARD